MNNIGRALRRPNVYCPMPQSQLYVFQQSRLFASGDTTTNQSKKQRNKKHPEFLYGINPILASLQANRREFRRLFLDFSEKGREELSNPKLDKIKKMCNHYGVRVKYLAKKKMQDMTKTR